MQPSSIQTENIGQASKPTAESSLKETQTYLVAEAKSALEKPAFEARNTQMAKAVGAETSLLAASSVGKLDKATELEGVFTKAAIEAGDAFKGAFDEFGNAKPQEEGIYKSAQQQAGKFALDNLPYALNTIDNNTNPNLLLRGTDFKDILTLTAHQLGKETPQDLTIDQIRESLHKTAKGDYFEGEIDKLPFNPSREVLTNSQQQALDIGVRLANATWKEGQVHRAAWEGNDSRIDPNQREVFNPYDLLKTTQFERTMKQLETEGLSGVQAAKEALIRVALEVYKDVIELKKFVPAEITPPELPNEQPKAESVSQTTEFQVAQQETEGIQDGIEVSEATKAVLTNIPEVDTVLEGLRTGTLTSGTRGDIYKLPYTLQNLGAQIDGSTSQDRKEQLEAARREICERGTALWTQDFIQRDYDKLSDPKKWSQRSEYVFIAWTEGKSIGNNTLNIGKANSPREQIDKLRTYMQGEEYQRIAEKMPDFDRGAREYLAGMGRKVAENPNITKEDIDKCKEMLQPTEIVRSTETINKTMMQISERIQAIDAAQTASEVLAVDEQLKAEKESLIATRAEICEKASHLWNLENAQRDYDKLSDPKKWSQRNEYIMIFWTNGEWFISNSMNLGSRANSPGEQVVLLEKYIQGEEYKGIIENHPGFDKGVQVYLSTLREKAAINISGTNNSSER